MGGGDTPWERSEGVERRGGGGREGRGLTHHIRGAIRHRDYMQRERGRDRRREGGGSRGRKERGRRGEGERREGGGDGRGGGGGGE